MSLGDWIHWATSLSLFLNFQVILGLMFLDFLLGFLTLLQHLCLCIEVLNTFVDTLDDHYIKIGFSLREDYLDSWIRTLILIKDNNLCCKFVLTYQYARLWHLNICLILCFSLIYFLSVSLEDSNSKWSYSFLDKIISSDTNVYHFTIELIIYIQIVSSGI